MDQKFRNFAISFLAIMLFFPGIVQASGEKHPDEIFQLLGDAFTAQVKLSEQNRSLAEVDALLNPFFTEYGKEQFLTENLQQENGRYFTLGTDAAFYYIPFFSYDNRTVIKEWNGDLYVYEFFEESAEGPVSFESHYEAVKLEEDNGVWKVSEVIYEMPAELLAEPDIVPEQQVASFSNEESETAATYYLNPVQFMFLSANDFYKKLKADWM